MSRRSDRRHRQPAVAQRHAVGGGVGGGPDRSDRRRPAPAEPPQPLMVIGVAPIAAGGGAKNPAIQTAVAPTTGA